MRRLSEVTERVSFVKTPAALMRMTFCASGPGTSWITLKARICVMSKVEGPFSPLMSCRFCGVV
jgi:hypothetical protein